jgi:hypothetical protein
MKKGKRKNEEKKYLRGAINTYRLRTEVNANSKRAAAQVAGYVKIKK